MFLWIFYWRYCLENVGEKLMFCVRVEGGEWSCGDGGGVLMVRGSSMV